MTQLRIEWGPAKRLKVGRGPLDAERMLLEELEELLPRSPEDLADTFRPVLLLVPSKSLRWHLLGRVMEHRGSAALGLECLTHHALALNLLEKVGTPSPERPDLFPLIARRLARREEPLRKSLDHLRDGYAAVLGPVRDLLDAGIDPAHVDALEEALATESSRSSRREIARARSLVRVAAGTAAELRSYGLSRGSILFQQATEILARAGGDIDHPLPASHIIIYGFNDATGVTTDFLLAAIGATGGSFYLENPPQPSERTAADPGLSFSRSFRERIETSIPAAQEDDDREVVETPAPEIALFRALGAQAEVREVAHRVRDLLDGKSRAAPGRTAPEKIGVVARQLEQYSGALRIQFDRLGIPYSGLAKIGPFDPSSGRLHAVLQLLRERSRTPVERWLDAADLAPTAAAANDLLVAFRVLGAARLQDAAGLRIDAIVERGGLRLPVRTGLEERRVDAATSGDDSARAARGDRTSRAAPRWLAAHLLARAVEAAQATCDAFDKWPKKALAGVHARKLSHLVREILGGSERQAETSSLSAELRRTMASLPAELELDSDEMFLFLRLELEKTGRTELGGRGGGVQVLDVIEARSRTFDHLFLLGLNRGTFPRAVEEDPLLPDPLRHVLGRSGFGVLPDLPVKKKGFHEERYLFAQLLSSSPRITLSWQEVDEQQNLRAVSPLVERLRLSEARPGEDPDEIPTARPLYSPDAAGLLRPRPAHEAAVLAGIHHPRGNDASDPGRGVFGEALEAALAEAVEAAEDPTLSVQELAAARLRILDELDPPPFTEIGRGPGPYLGFVGAIRGGGAGGGDPRSAGSLYVTALQGLARCPWQHFLLRVLRIEPLPDPLETVPGIEALHVGQVIHDVLEDIVAAGLEEPPRDWDEARAAEGSVIAWPRPDALEELVSRKARSVVLSRSLGLPGLDRALARTALPHLEVARREDWPEGHSRWPVVAAEIEGRLPLPGSDPGSNEPRQILFRADRMDRRPAGGIDHAGDASDSGEGGDGGEGGLSFTDYKTGRWSPGKGKSTSAGQRLLEAVREGEWLQAAAYALAGADGTGRGRYLFLNPLFDDEAGRVFALSAHQPSLVDNFSRAVAALISVWDTGSHFPRLLDWKGEKEPTFCSFCEVSDACVRGDSGARRRLRDWVKGLAGPQAEATREGAAVSAAWHLAQPRPRGKKR